MKNRVMVIVLVCFCFLAVSVDVFATSYSTSVTISKIVNYNGFPSGGADVVVYFTGSSIATCQAGFWMGVNEPAFKSTLALIISARTSSNGQIDIVVDDSNLWSGGVPGVCHVYAVTLN